MGLFSKKDYVCSKCGKTYQSRFGAGANLCDDCLLEEAEKEKQERDAKKNLEESIKGYVRYGKDVLGKNYTLEEMQEIKNHRDNLLKQLKIEQHGISIAELQEASDNYKSLSDEQCIDVLTRVKKSKVTIMTGAGFNEFLLLPTDYETVVVPMNDVFAIGFVTDTKVKDSSVESIMCAFFTNDPYIPVIGMQHIAKKGMFEVLKSKKGRELLTETFEILCPNLAYPIDDLKVLEKTIKGEQSVKGKIEYKSMLHYISDAKVCVSIFDTSRMSGILNEASETMINEINYISDSKVDFIMKMDKFMNRSFWESKMK